MPGKSYKNSPMDYKMKKATANPDRTGMMSAKTVGRGGRIHNEPIQEKLARMMGQSGY